MEKKKGKVNKKEKSNDEFVENRGTSPTSTISTSPIIHPPTPLRTRARFPTIVLATETRAATRNCRGARGVHLSLSDAARSTRTTAIWTCFLQ
uniref:Uncharacterized protein n=1 Tax=Oryza meridionalis TaxID=40149 RepID=A0A0E0DPU9_9ORYZ